jgi:hypothetical protein
MGAAALGAIRDSLPQLADFGGSIWHIPDRLKTILPENDLYRKMLTSG